MGILGSVAVSDQFSTISQSSWVWSMWQNTRNCTWQVKEWALGYGVFVKGFQKSLSPGWLVNILPSTLLIIAFLQSLPRESISFAPLDGRPYRNFCLQQMFPQDSPSIVLQSIPLVCSFPLAFWKCFSCVCVFSFLQFRAICAVWRASSFHNMLGNRVWVTRNLIFLLL